MESRSLKRRHVLFSSLPPGLDFSDFEEWPAWGCSEEGNNGLTPPRQLPISMQEKRHLREKQRLQHSRIRYQTQRGSCRRALEGARHLASALSLWKRPLSEIEGRFGSGIHSFFTFLRFLIFLNLVVFTLTTACVLVPTIFFTKPSGAAGATGGAHPRWDPHCVNASAMKPRSQVDIHTFVWHVFTGEGLLETSYIFYGHYQQGETTGSSFSIRLAYLFSVLASLLFCFIWITRQMVNATIQKRMHSRDYRPRLSTKIFTGWDYCIRSVEAGATKQHSICNDLKMDLEEEVRYVEKLKMVPLRKAVLTLTRVLVNMGILLLMAGAFYCIFLVTTISQEHVQSFSSGTEWRRNVLKEYLPPIVINLANFLLPMAFAAMGRLENYSPNTEVNLTLMRNVLLKLASLGIFLFSLAQKMLCVGYRDNPSCLACGYNKNYQCWETTLGQEMYKMTIFNFLSTLLTTLLVRIPRRLIVDKTSWRLAQMVGKEEFVVPLNILDIVDEQTVVWIGVFYSPLLPLINSIFLFITFYLKKYTLCNLCKPSKKLFRASSSKFFFQFVLFLGLSLASFPLLYSIFNSAPSRGCGLFANYQTAWHVVPEAVATYLSPTAQSIVNYAGSKAFAFPLVIILCLVLTVYVSQDRENRQAIKELKTRLVMEAKDKRFLVKELSSAVVETTRIWEEIGTAGPYDSVRKALHSSLRSSQAL